MAGVLRPIDTGKGTKFLGYSNHGGTLCENGLLYANSCTWGHVIEAVGDICNINLNALLTSSERAALRGEANPALLWSPRGETE
jgi:hypothetical protein